MAWKKYTPVISGKSKPAVSMTVPDSTLQATPFLSIDDATLKQLGWKAGTALAVMIGDGEHDGQIRIEPMQGEPAELRAPSKDSRRTRSFVRIGRMPVLTENSFKGAVPFEIEKTQGGGKPECALIVTLPDAARAHKLPRGTIAALAKTK